MRNSGLFAFLVGGSIFLPQSMVLLHVVWDDFSRRDGSSDIVSFVLGCNSLGAAHVVL